MTCIKTGARVYFENYDMVVAADLHIVGNCTIIYWNPHSAVYGYLSEGDRAVKATHIVGLVAFSGGWFHRDSGITVVTSDLIWENEDNVVPLPTAGETGKTASPESGREV